MADQSDKVNVRLRMFEIRQEELERDAREYAPELRDDFERYARERINPALIEGYRLGPVTDVFFISARKKFEITVRTVIPPGGGTLTERIEIPEGVSNTISQMCEEYERDRMGYVCLRLQFLLRETNYFLNP